MSPEAEFTGFRIDEVLSRSSTTNVYRAFQHSLQRTVLIKELRPELFQEEDLRLRFEREAKACARIKHENIVVIHHYSAESDRIYLVMEYVDGSSLADFLSKNPNPPIDHIYAIILQTLRGLDFAHSQGVIHRDLKPENILISRDGWIKISDFGLAQFEGTPQVTRAGAIVGTPAYLSPEAISGGAVTNKSDLFSLGVTFYQVFTGKKIFYAEHFSDSLNKVLSYHPKKPSQFRSDIPPEIDRIILRMLEKQPAKRWGSCEEIISELEKLNAIAKLDDPKRIVRKIWEMPAGRTAEPEKISIKDTVAPIRLKRRILIWASLIVLLVLFLLYGKSFLGGGERAGVPEFTEVGDTTSNSASEPIVETTSPDPSIDTVQTAPGESYSRDDSTVLNKSEEKPIVEKSIITEEVQKQPAAAGLETESTAQESVAVVVDNEVLADLSLPKIPARLYIQCDPWADVYIDDILVGKTPFDYVQVEPGERRIIFRHPEFTPIFRDVEVESGGEINLAVNFWETVGRIVVLVNPWAEVYLNGNLIDVTPLKEPIIVPLGTSTITLKNPAADPWEKKLRFDRGDPPCTLRVDLQPVKD